MNVLEDIRGWNLMYENPKRLIVAVSGHIGSGKDTLGDYLVKEFNFIKLKLAYPIYDLVATLLGIYDSVNLSHRDKFDDREWKENNVFRIGDISYTVRQLLQKVGTECFRMGLQDDIWIQLLLKEIKQYPVDQHLVITDLRFKNENLYLVTEYPKEYRLVYIMNPDATNAQEARFDDAKSEGKEYHVSEGYLDGLRSLADIHIFNPGVKAGIQEYYDNIYSVFDYLLP
jgi:hypothetical protein